MTTDKTIEKLSDLTLDKLGEICQEEGVTVRKVCELLYDGMNAETVKLDSYGKPIEESKQPDMPTRHKYMMSAMEVLKLVKKEVPVSNVINVNNINMSPEKLLRIETAIKEIEDLNNKIKENPVYRGKVIDVESATVIR